MFWASHSLKRWTLVLLLLSGRGEASLPDTNVSTPGEQRAAAPASEPLTLPLDVQLAYLLKALDYDVDRKSEFKQEIRIGVIYAAENPGSVAVQNELTQYLRSYSGTRRIIPAAVAFTGIDRLKEIVNSSRFNLFYICPGNASNLPDILSVAKEGHILTATGVRDYVEKGVSIGMLGVSPRGETKVALFLNSRTAKWEAGLMSFAIDVVR